MIKSITILIFLAKTQWHYSPSPPKKLFQSWEPYNVTLIPPCKVNVESHGSFAKNHPEKIGTYHLIPSLWINNRPVWMQESEGGSYLRANTFGSWIICKVSFLNQVFIFSALHRGRKWPLFVQWRFGKPLLKLCHKNVA